jgi:hypothetical protein
MFGPNVVIAAHWQAAGNPTTILTSIVTGGTTRSHDMIGTATTDTFQLARPGAGVTLTGNFCVQSRRTGWVSSPTVCGGWTYTEMQVLPPPILDSIVTDTTLTALNLLPDTISVVVGQQVEFCPVLHFVGGAVTLRAADQTAGCIFYLQGSLAASAAQQARAEQVCLTWTVGGGSFSVRHPCDVVGG